MHHWGPDGSLPPHASYDSNGKPLLSWRVLILPQIAQDDLYSQFHLDEPWDSPHNLTLLPKMPRTYADPRRRWHKGDYLTPFQVFVGPGTLFEGPKGVRLSDVPDGTSATISVVRADCLVPWTKPEDLPYSPDGPLPEFMNKRRARWRVLFADAHFRDLRSDLPEGQVRALITRNGGEQIDWQELER